LITVLEQQLQWRDYITSLQNGSPDVKLIGQALSEAFLHIDVLIRQHQDKCRQEATGYSDVDTSGCTAVVCVVTPTHIICSNAGDSRCIIGISDNRVKPLSDDHKVT